MQWEGQELQTQLFSPNGAAQEVPVSQEPSAPAALCPCTAVPVEKKKKELLPVLTRTRLRFCSLLSSWPPPGFTHQRVTERRRTQSHLPAVSPRPGQPTTGAFQPPSPTDSRFLRQFKPSAT